MQKTLVTYLLYKQSQYAAFDRPNKMEVMVITPGRSAAMGDLKISKTDVNVQWLKKTEENKHGPVIPGCSAKSETLYWD